MEAQAERTRYSLLDAIRGFAVVNMIVYHLLYDILCVFGGDMSFATSTAAVIWERFICCTFILVSGISAHFTRRAYRRGIIVNLCGFLITAVTVLTIPEQAIWFGILNLIGCAMMITYALREVLDRIPPAVGAAVSALLWVVLSGLPNRNILGFELPDWLYGCKYLAFIGLPSEDFFSADYFPLLPWISMYFCGYFLWSCIEAKGGQRLFLRKIPVLDFIGRHSLMIYLLHQPVIYGICWLIFR